MATPTEYTYSIQNDTAHGTVKSSQLQTEINAQSSGVIVAVDHIITEDDSLFIIMKNPLTTDEKTALDAVVHAHIPVVIVDTPAKRDTDGKLIVRQSFGDVENTLPIFRGYNYTATHGVESFFDEEITTEIKLQGGDYIILDGNAQIGDYIEFSVIDKNDVLGYFGAFGLVVGEDVLELLKPIKHDPISPRNDDWRTLMVNAVYPVIAGLFFRTGYNSVGDTNDVKFGVSYRVYQV